MKTPLVRGRYFNDHDTGTSERVAIVDERLARKFWPQMDPIGKRMYQPAGPDSLKPGDNTQWITVVGLIRDVRLEDLAGSATAGTYYFPATQVVPRGLQLAIELTGNPTPILQSVRAELKRLDPAMPFSNVRMMSEYMEQSLLPRRAAMLLAASFGAISLSLSAVGIYGVLAYTVAQRQREIGIRIALGSTTGGIFGLVLREGALLILSGFAFGLIGTVLLRSVLQNQIYGLGAMDLRILSLAGFGLGAIALTACALPARRATRVDPAVVLNQT
jgi:putative ABC transport system permease protein